LMICSVFVVCLLALTAHASASAADEATPAAAIHVHDGFAVERIYSVPREQGSWVAMCFDGTGRIYASDQGGRLFRITPPPAGAVAPATVEVVSDQWGFSQGMAFIQGRLYLIQHGDRALENPTPDRLLRISDTDGDDRLDSAETLHEFPLVTGDAANWVEHSLHAVVPAPDGRSIVIISGDRNGLPCSAGCTPKHWNRDSWEHGFTPEPYPGGWVVRADLDGGNMEYLCMGLRNAYDMAFNRHGDLFTFDSDLENDFGLPNYRPTAIRQIVSGADAGWGGRAGEMLWSWTPAWEEIQPPLKNIGPGSPTGVCFGFGARFPARYQQALFACDWSYGRMFAVHLQPEGAAYTADPEPFLSAQGLPIADVAVSPADGALYFLTGGRGTQSGLYRVVYTGAESTAPAADTPLSEATAAAQRLRRRLEQFHGRADPAAYEVVWPQLAHTDRAIRGAARAAIEWQPVAQWKERALRESDPRTALQALLALARSTDGDQSVQPLLLEALERFNVKSLPPDEQCWYLRILTVSASRHGRYAPEVAARLLARLEPLLPAPDSRVNEEIVALAAALNSHTFQAPTLDLLEHSRTQEEQVVYTQALVKSAASTAWTPELRERFFKIATERLPQWKGGATARGMRDHLLHIVVAMLTDAQRAAFADQIAAARQPSPAVPAINRPLVKQWSMDDLVPGLDAALIQPRDLDRGRRLFSAAACIACHSFQGEGGLGGPDLTTAGNRYSPRDLLENILHPSKVINEQYGLLIYTKTDGTTLIGRTVNMAGDTVMIATNPNDPGGSEVRFTLQELESTTPSQVSFMPHNLLDTLSPEEIYDLLAYLRSR
ncbi:MAG: c-type cytochrome, partial [Planctomycetota bacterium]